MIREQDLVRTEGLHPQYGRVTRLNWSNQAEVRWDDGTVSMCAVDELIEVDPIKERLNGIYNQIPQLQNMTEAWSDGRWVISKPIASPELTLRNRIKNAWAVFRGKAFAIKWY